MTISVVVWASRLNPFGVVETDICTFPLLLKQISVHFRCGRGSNEFEPLRCWRNRYLYISAVVGVQMNLNPYGVVEIDTCVFPLLGIQMNLSPYGFAVVRTGLRLNHSGVFGQCVICLHNLLNELVVYVDNYIIVGTAVVVFWKSEKSADLWVFIENNIRCIA